MRPSWRPRLAGSPKPGYGAFHALVSGSVQGVGFRYQARREAQRLGLVGWVLNKDDGDVEIWAEGSIEDLAEFRSWLEEGPPGAIVSSLRAEKRDPTGNYTAFTIEF